MAAPAQKPTGTKNIAGSSTLKMKNAPGKTWQMPCLFLGTIVLTKMPSLSDIDFALRKCYRFLKFRISKGDA